MILAAAKIFAIISIISTGAIFGFFYAYYCSVMWGLDASSPRSAIHAMQNINQSVRNPVFFPTFFLTPAFILITAMLSYFVSRSGWWFVAGAITYIAGGAILTNMTNVPLNAWLAEIKTPQNMEAAKEIWRQYSANWQGRNLTRMIASGLTLVFISIGVMNLGKN